jgi:hypothetical protein
MIVVVPRSVAGLTQAPSKLDAPRTIVDNPFKISAFQRRGLFFALSSFLRSSILCFQHFTALFPKTRGWGIPPGEYWVGPALAVDSLAGVNSAVTEKVLGRAAPLWYYLVAFDALVSPLEREESGREVTLAAFFYVRPKTARLCEGLGKAPDSSI